MIRDGKKFDEFVILIRGAGEMASGVAHKLVQCGFRVLLTEMEMPLAIRRTVAYAECVYTGAHTIESIPGCRVASLEEARTVLEASNVPVIVDPHLQLSQSLLRAPGTIIIDARMLKKGTTNVQSTATPVIGLGPGFSVPQEARFVIETNRGHDLGRVIESGGAQANTGIPAEVNGHTSDRVVYAPQAGVFHALRQIADKIEKDEPLGQIESQLVVASCSGVLRGILHEGVSVSKHTKVADVDSRGDPARCYRISDKARAIAGGALEAVLRIVNSL